MKVAEVVLLRMFVDVQGVAAADGWPMVDRMPLFVDVSMPRSGTGDVFGQISPRRRGGRSHQGKSFRVEETAAIPARRRALVRFVGRRVGRETRPATARPCGVPRPGRGPRVSAVARAGSIPERERSWCRERVDAAPASAR